tara:strand:- start:263 stop:529 length:267 start_codon:yes stop_codon:yes gene_type:complete
MESKEYMELKREIEELSDCVKMQGETIKKIHSAIVGDKDFGQEGIVQMVRKHDRWITSQKFMWAKIYGGIAVGSTIATILVKFWDKIF